MCRRSISNVLLYRVSFIIVACSAVYRRNLAKMRDVRRFIINWYTTAIFESLAEIISFTANWKRWLAQSNNRIPIIILMELFKLQLSSISAAKLTTSFPNNCKTNVRNAIYSSAPWYFYSQVGGEPTKLINSLDWRQPGKFRIWKYHGLQASSICRKQAPNCPEVYKKYLAQLEWLV